MTWFWSNSSEPKTAEEKENDEKVENEKNTEKIDKDETNDTSAADQKTISEENKQNSGSFEATHSHATPKQSPPQDTNEKQPSPTSPINSNILFQSNRLQSYITLAVASFINFDAAVKSENSISSTYVPSTYNQRVYAETVALVSLITSLAVIVVHLDGFTPLQRLWKTAFRPKSSFELTLIGFLILWWVVATGVQTSVTGMAGDARGQDSFYYSSWVSVLTSFGLLDGWLIDAGDTDGVRAFISSWPNRAPAWLCIVVMSVATLVSVLCCLMDCLV